MARSIRVEDLLHQFGVSLVGAQNRILKAALENPSPLDGLRTAYSITEAELDVKMVFAEKGGATEIQPMTTGEGRLQDLNPGVLSAFKAKIVIVPDEEGKPPRRKPEDIRGEVLNRPDLKRLAKVFGDLTVNVSYIPAASRWLVDVVEPGGHTLRSMQIDDGVEEKRG